MKVICHKNSDFFNSDLNEQKWNKLFAESIQPTVFQRFEWNKVWWEVNGGNCDLRIYILEDESGEWLIAAPLCISTEPGTLLRKKTIRILGTRDHSNDYGEFLIAHGREKYINLILQTVMESQNEWKHLILSHLREDGPTMRSFHEFICPDINNKTLHQIVFQTKAPAIDLKDKESALKLLSKKSIKRKINHFKKTGELEFKIITKKKEAEQYFELFFEQHIGRRALTGEKSLFRNSHQCEFYKKIFDSLIPDNTVHFSVVLHNQSPIAFHFGFSLDGVFYWYKPSFSAELSKKSPGEVLIYHLIKECIENEMLEFDFTVGMESFKYRFSNIDRNIFKLTIYRNFFECFVDKLYTKIRKSIKFALNKFKK